MPWYGRERAWQEPHLRRRPWRVAYHL